MSTYGMPKDVIARHYIFITSKGPRHGERKTEARDCDATFQFLEDNKVASGMTFSTLCTSQNPIRLNCRCEINFAISWQ